MPRSLKVGSCSCSSLGNIEDLLHCAPCPPPMISYEELRDHALNRSLILNDVCIIARRCNINGTDIVVDCPPVTPDCPPSTTIHTYVAGYVSGIMVPVVVAMIITMIIAIIVIFICVRKRKEMKDIYQSFIKKCCRNKKSSTDKSSDPTSIEETTFSCEVKVDEVKVLADAHVSTTDPEETTALVHVETEKTLESFVLAPEAVLEGKEEKPENDLDNNEATLYEEGTMPIPLEKPVQENIKYFPKEKSDKSVQEQFEPLLPKHAEMIVKEDLEPVSQDSSETCHHENLRNGVQSHPGTSVKESDNNSIIDADSDSFHSVESEQDTDS